MTKSQLSLLIYLAQHLRVNTTIPTVANNIDILLLEVQKEINE